MSGSVDDVTAPPADDPILGTIESAARAARRGDLTVAAASSPARVGVFGGTFDPPHVGHLVTAVNVAHELDLDVVILMVNNVPWQKEASRAITPAEDRFAMVAAAVERVPHLVPGRHEIDAGGDSYTADTLAVVADEYPDATLYTILGDDAAAGLTTWERHEEVAERSELVVVDRPGDLVELPGGFEWIRVEVPRLEVSSTDLRARFTDGRPLDYLVTPGVLQVIHQRGLYGVTARAAWTGDDTGGELTGPATAMGDADLRGAAEVGR